jgi:hypothetical protein
VNSHKLLLKWHIQAQIMTVNMWTCNLKYFTTVGNIVAQ